MSELFTTTQACIHSQLSGAMGLEFSKEVMCLFWVLSTCLGRVASELHQ